MNDPSRAPVRWTLADLIDFEALLAEPMHTAATGQRLRFARDVRPQLGGGPSAAVRRRGLRLWLDTQRDAGAPSRGRLWRRGIALARAVVFVAMAVGGTGLAVALCLGPAQAVHVVVFVALGLLVPWLLFVVLLLIGLAGRLSQSLLREGVALVWRLAARARTTARIAGAHDWAERLTDTPNTRRALAAELGGVLQWGGLGFQVGLLVTFVAVLLVFDVRFYWEATPQSDAVVRTVVEGMAAPWSWAWPAAVPDVATIEASRAHYIGAVKQLPPASATARWWRFLLMALLIWGVLPRCLLIAAYRLRRDRALARLDFQAPRHRALWRRLAGVQRGRTAPAAGDTALVLDVGGIGLDGEAVRGFLLRRLRVSPGKTCRVSVLDEAAEAAADAALAERPGQVVLLVADWALSPRQAATLQRRVRAAIGASTPMTWVVATMDNGVPGAPRADQLARWTAFVDGLQDPATEIAGYDPAA